MLHTSNSEVLEAFKSVCISICQLEASKGMPPPKNFWAKLPQPQYGLHLKSYVAICDTFVSLDDVMKVSPTSFVVHRTSHCFLVTLAWLMAHKFYCHLFPVGKLFLIRGAYWKIFSFLTNSFLVFNATLGITTLLTTNISSLEKLKSRGWWGFVNHHECPTLCRVVIQLLSDTWARSLLPLTKV